MRKRLKESEAKHLGFKLREKDNQGRNPRYTLTQKQNNELKELRSSNVSVKSETKSNNYEKPFNPSAWNEKGYMMDINEYCQFYNLPRNDVKSYKLVTHTSVPYYNVVFNETAIEKEINFDFIEGLVQKYIKPINIEISYIKHTDYFDRVVYTDVHIGMTPNENGYSLYGGKWDEKELDNRLYEMVEFLKSNKKGNLLVIDDLGDFVDGWDGETTRKGHKLPQNMNNQEMFDVGVSFKVKMIDMLVNDWDEILVNNICEDNHAGSFGYVINSAFKSIIKHKYPSVKVNNHRKFINHYYIENHCFVISHGKDSKSLKFGFKPQLDPKQIEKIDGYLKNNGIYKNADFIEFSKGDSHQMLLDYCTSDDFDYFNYPALSPSSEWVQTNFKKGRSGFVMQNVYYEENLKEIKPYFFK